MKLTKEERDQKIKDRDTAYYSLINSLSSIKYQLDDMKGHRRSPAFKMLDVALVLVTDQIRADYDRYVRRIRVSGVTEDLAMMQKALNREKIKNAELEKKINEARTSSGLFIDFVRKQLKF